MSFAKHIIGVENLPTELSEFDIQQACLPQAGYRHALITVVMAAGAPFSNTRSVAKLMPAEIVMLMRGISEKNACLHRGGWTMSAARPSECSPRNT